MLRLKQALEECGIQQKALAEITGFGKTQISLTLNSGKLPANRDKFVNGVFALVGQENGLSDWLVLNHLDTADLCSPVGGPAAAAPADHSADLERTLCEIAGRTVLAVNEGPDMTLRLARATAFLHTALRTLVGQDTPWLQNNSIAVLAILKGETP